MKISGIIFLFVFLPMATVPLCAQMTPQEPVKNFRLPMFGENGYRIWELTGDEGRYLTSEKIQVSDMKLTVFSGTEASLVENRIESPLATLFITKNIAIGEGPIQIISERYRVEGQRWFWDGKSRSVVVSRNAQVIFFENINQ